MCFIRLSFSQNSRLFLARILHRVFYSVVTKSFLSKSARWLSGPCKWCSILTRTLLILERVQYIGKWLKLQALLDISVQTFSNPMHVQKMQWYSFLRERFFFYLRTKWESKLDGFTLYLSNFLCYSSFFLLIS